MLPQQIKNMSLLIELNQCVCVYTYAHDQDVISKTVIDKYFEAILVMFEQLY